MVKNKEFLGSTKTNPHYFRHYDLSSCALNVNGTQIQTEGLSRHGSREDVSHWVQDALQGSGIHHSNSGLQIINDMYLNGYFMLLFDLSPDRDASEGHKSHLHSGNFIVELKFSNPLSESVRCIFYLEYDNSVSVAISRTVSTDCLIKT